ncbi:restriction endonuclease subunit S [Leptospira kanakyensis]|uniref:restriction endonuclease subunit S n=1 Tax=Leptospira kanakyensis TaxID=2484968 RepID=UPI00223CAD47|nr:restriction endonuclease subunit S [Leptospira kanakyensis]MCW7470569.1 restriction endonuclease subunit S [Leptospira kanakyensis]
METNFISLLDATENIVDNRGRTCPTVSSGKYTLIATNCISNEYLYPRKINVRYIDENTYANWFRSHPLPNDIIFVTKGDPGRCCLVPEQIDFVIAQDMVTLRAKKGIVDTYYLLALLRSELARNAIINMHVGTMIPHFKKGDFGNLLLPFPKISQQRAIGEIFYKIESKIELLRKMNETLEAMAKALFQSWFVDFDPVRKKAEGIPTGLPKEIEDLFPSEFEESELGEIPKGWKVGNLGEISVLNPESWNEKNHPERIFYLDLSNVKNNQIQNLEEFNYNTAPSRARRVLKNNDTIIGTVRPGNRSYAFIKQNGLTGSTGFAVLRPNSKTHAEFLYLATTSNEMIDYYAHHADGGAYPAISPNFIFNQKYIICPDSVMLVFHQYTNNLLSLVEINNTEIYSLSSLRDSLLPKLISGELEITDKMITQILETAK